MKNRIEQLMETKSKDILSIYFTAGYPQLEDTLSLVQHLDKAGVDMIEIGFPFSDPLADGPVIQASSQQAIANGMSLKIVFDQLRTLREKTNIPVLLMGYLNPILQYGEKEFLTTCHEVGIDGLIIPDMPIDYYHDHFEENCRSLGLSNILLITPETTEERIHYIDRQTTGFIYMVSSNSITGVNTKFNATTAYFERIRQMNLRHRTMIGFGINNHESFRKACNYSSGAIIGTAFIQHITTHGTSFESVEAFVKKIKF